MARVDVLKEDMISVVLATHNEAKNIIRCLESVQGFADEVIVVDGESSDDTVELARSMGAKVVSTTNKANFHINKQQAMDEAKGELVLQLDADEVVDEQLSSHIKQIHSRILAEPEQSITAWKIARKNLFLGSFLKKGGQYPDFVIRLYINGYAHLPQKDVHEQMIVNGEVGIAGGHLIHYANPTFADYLRKWNTYTSFKAQQLLDQGKKPSFLDGIWFLIFKPAIVFASMFIRHKGFVDGTPGFVFALMSGLHHSMSYLKLWELQYKQHKQ